MYSSPTFRTGQGDVSPEVPQSLRHLVSPFPDDGGAGGPDDAPTYPLWTAPWGDARLAGLGWSPYGDPSRRPSGLGGMGSTDQASTIWKNIKPGDVLTLAALHVLAQADGWHDATSGATLTQEESDYRSESLMAALVHATMAGPQQAWTDNTDGHPLSNDEAFSRWSQSYGPSTTIETVLKRAGQTATDPSIPTAPLGQGGTVPFPVPTNFPPPPQPTGGTLPVFSPSGLTTKPPIAAAAPSRTLLYVGVGLVVVAVAGLALSRRRPARAS